MICPVQIARDLSALRAAGVGDHAGMESYSKAATERAMKVQFAGAGEEDHVVAGGKAAAAGANVTVLSWLWREKQAPFSAAFSLAWTESS